MKFVGKGSSTVGFKNCRFFGGSPSVEGVGVFVAEDCGTFYAEQAFDLVDVGSAYVSNSIGVTRKMISVRGGGGVLSLNNEHRPPVEGRPENRRLNRRERRAERARARHKND